MIAVKPALPFGPASHHSTVPALLPLASLRAAARPWPSRKRECNLRGRVADSWFPGRHSSKDNSWRQAQPPGRPYLKSPHLLSQALAPEAGTEQGGRQDIPPARQPTSGRGAPLGPVPRMSGILAGLSLHKAGMTGSSLRQQVPGCCPGMPAL